MPKGQKPELRRIAVMVSPATLANFKIWCTRKGTTMQAYLASEVHKRAQEEANRG